MNKPLKIVLFTLVVLILAVPIVVMSRASTLIRSAVESYGPDLIGVSVSLGNVTFSLIDGEAGLERLVVGNPPGFKSDYAFSLKQMQIKLDPLSLFSDRIEIEELLIDQPDLIWEIRKGGSNFQALQKNLPVSGADDDSESELLVMIDHVYLNGTRVAVEGLPINRDTSMTLPDLHIEDIGRDQGGVTFGTAMDEIFRVLMPVITQTALSQQIEGLSGEMVGDLKAKGETAVEELKDKVESKLKRRLGGLLGGKDKDEEEGGN